MAGYRDVNRDAMFRYVADFQPVELIAVAWLVIADFDLDPTGKTVSMNFYTDSGDDDWCKFALRTIRGFAESNVRPTGYPWPSSAFDRFPWAG